VERNSSSNSNSAGTIRFGPFELDLRAGELRKGDARIRLPDQPFQVLLMLLERPGDVVLREEIRNKLWPGSTVVEFDHSINAAVRRLRDALRESADKPRYLETLPRRGYRFIGQVKPAAEVPARAITPSIAVLPFADLSGDRENEYFSDGLAEEIINNLTRAPGLKVIARTSAFAAACCGGCRYRPMMSAALVSNSGSSLAR
jgi:DNA-binding winged helix-turn-helix (wHTH) protein